MCSMPTRPARGRRSSSPASRRARSRCPCRLPPGFNGGPTLADLAAHYLRRACRGEAEAEDTQSASPRRAPPPHPPRTRQDATRRNRAELRSSISSRSCATVPVTANRAVKVLSHMYRLGEGWGMVPEGCDPCRSVEKYPGAPTRALPNRCRVRPAWTGLVRGRRQLPALHPSPWPRSAC